MLLGFFFFKGKGLFIQIVVLWKHQQQRLEDIKLQKPTVAFSYLNVA